MKAELTSMDGGPPIPITKDITVIGRREGCDVQLDDPSLSKRHCILVKTDGLLMIRDLATTNGTKVKGQLIRWAALLPNDRITLGRLKFRVFLGPDDAPASAKPEAPRARPRSKRPSKPSRLAATPNPLPPMLAAPLAAQREDRTPDGLNDPGWFARLAAEEDHEEIIDLE